MTASGSGDYGTGRWFGDEIPVEQQRLQIQERVLDPETIRVLERLDVQPSWRCLELGAGAGSNGV